MLVIVNYGMGNVGSILNMLKKVKVQAIVSSDSGDIEKADRLILPGVGSFDAGIERIASLGLFPVLNQKVIKEQIPLLGICLGMQLLTRESEEGNVAGLGWLDAQTIKFKFTQNGDPRKIPHMGWNSVNLIRESCLFKGLEQESRFYFAHSYHVVCSRQEDILAITPYSHDFVSAINHKNIFGVQFHPEKSHTFGMRLLKNFILI